ncbi:MAG: Holliday junction resolvase RuvX [Acidobacteria bacterium]|nr:Holliday junction resolvase RuvX [Acidobacteriota bacterium]
MPVQDGNGDQSNAEVAFSDQSRVMALDWGDKRVGVAISDPLGLTAQGLTTMERRNRKQDLSFLRSLVRKHNVSLILLGYPLNMSGTVGERAQRIRELANELKGALRVEVRLCDERLTTVEAHRVLQDAGIKAARRRESVDRVAAALLLQEFLDAQGRHRDQGGDQ